MPREPAPATDRKWIPAFAGMTKCGRERPELNNISRAAVDPRDSIHNARLIPPCIIGKNVSIENCTIGPNETIGDYSGVLCDKMKMYIWGGYDGYGCFRWLNLVYLAT